jgi:predicted ATPase
MMLHEVVRQQQAESWEFCATMSFARTWGDQGVAKEARETLSAAYYWLTEGFNARDLEEAKALPRQSWRQSGSERYDD